MDPYSAEGELVNIHNHFHQAQYQEVVDFDTSVFSPENELPAKVLVLRAQIAQGQAKEVLAETKGASEPELQAVAAFANQQLGATDEAVKAVEELAAAHGDNAIVQVVGGAVLQAAGKSEEALALLSQHSGNLEAVALIVQIHLQQNRLDLAQKEVKAARSWAQDSLLVNLAESWVGIREGGEKYQQSFYVFEELAQTPASSSTTSLISQAVTEIHLQRYEEAQAALDQVLAKEPQNPDALANLVVLKTLTGQDRQEALSALETAAPSHPLLLDWQEKKSEFEKAAAKFKPKVAAA
ncbi:hypothetical protein PFICI_06458 [Pestalotiopsis fici W106-1]|uniref:Coatomer subunit epsilon n=1 Tax=Pestalotiopsis fici (strain W106-1 / CGMCC3.15140) TaxID=1229662 RepID=W3X8E1_PESFW|nr:uncharacterized protein PFICI_06458 [Pestalotiopsis fici W106-1]ETS81456.1 hypothetical protein PFICI_06458 [Pestalotiopsis fici W106-1]